MASGDLVIGATPRPFDARGDCGEPGIRGTREERVRHCDRISAARATRVKGSS
ncbi:hypothetical protein WDJ51_08625 [Rathayibacter sp. YIM 133350]|uniref:hypothetical protein n=1 Tax=Rathayibacter sp. YIM 133350 TaxID=3131992 RepID=UPI00307D26C5